MTTLTTSSSENYSAPSYVKFLERKSNNADEQDQFIFKMLLEAKVKLNQHYRAIMSTTNGDPLGLEFKHDTLSQWAYITPEMSDLDLGAFRVQKFDEKGFFTHSTCKTIEAAVEILAEERFITLDAGRLDLVSNSYRWKSGLVSSELLNRISSGQISFEDGNLEFEQWKDANPDPALSRPKFKIA